jgi:hypothetical protein
LNQHSWRNFFGARSAFVGTDLATPTGIASRFHLHASRFLEMDSCVSYELKASPAGAEYSALAILNKGFL